jgi:outer membrane immunogenic protein
MPTLSMSATGGGTIGFDWQRNRLVFGVGAETGVIDLDGKRVDPNSVACCAGDTKTSFESDWYGALTGRAGIAFDRVLIFGRGGVAFLDAEAQTVDNCSTGSCGSGLIRTKDSDVLVGWTAGGGGSVALGTNWALGLEYRLFNFDDNLHPRGTSNFGFTNTQKVSLDDIQTVRLELDYRW